MQSMELANWYKISTWTLYVPLEHTPQKRVSWAQACADLLASPGCWLPHSLQQQALWQGNPIVAFCCPFSKRFVLTNMTERLKLPVSISLHFPLFLCTYLWTAWNAGSLYGNDLSCSKGVVFSGSEDYGPTTTRGKSDTCKSTIP